MSLSLVGSRFGTAAAAAAVAVEVEPGAPTPAPPPAPPPPVALAADAPSAAVVEAAACGRRYANRFVSLPYCSSKNSKSVRRPHHG